MNEELTNTGTNQETMGESAGWKASLLKKRTLVVVGALIMLVVVNAVLWPKMLNKYNNYGSQAWINTGTGNAVTPAASGESSGLLEAEPFAQADQYNGFELIDLRVPETEILRGGPPRDGIPAIVDPKFVAASEADYMRAADQVIGYVEDGMARAYPLPILVSHEIVNDTVAGRPIAATYCPLCGTCMVFDREYEGEVLTFGVSGLLYNSDVLMYDRQTESLWSQLKTEAISGEMSGTKLEWLPSEQMSWEAWLKKYPESEVLTTGGPMPRFDPYAGYEEREATMFPVASYRDDLPNKDWVLGIILNGTPKAYTFEALAKQRGNTFRDDVGGRTIEIQFDPDSRDAEVFDTAGNAEVPSVQAYWFAWQAFYPETELMK